MNSKAFDTKDTKKKNKDTKSLFIKNFVTLVFLGELRVTSLVLATLYCQAQPQTTAARNQVTR